MGEYESYLASKQRIFAGNPVPADLSDAVPLFDFQRDIVRWALARGKAAIWADTGLGKSRMQLAWAQCIPGDVLILAPLSVAPQTAREGASIGIPVTVCREASDVRPGINITNYDRLHKFDCARFAGVVLDESSIIKNHTAKTLAMLLESFRKTPWKLCASATPSPNDYTELGTHAEFLGVCSRTEMLAEYFIHDMAHTQDWRLKGHASKLFWQWVSTWGCMVRQPSDLGYSDDAYKLPPLNTHFHIVGIDQKHAWAAGQLFATEAQGLMDRRTARMASLDQRVQQCADLVNSQPDEKWLVWCEYNDEGKRLTSMINGAVEVAGSDDIETKEQRLDDFAAGKTRVLVSKASICGWGLNFQHVARIAFVGVTDSYESTYQAIRRAWRFGQKRPVDAHFFASEEECAVVRNMARKQEQADTMAKEMLAFVKDSIRARGHAVRAVNVYEPAVKMAVPGWLNG
jgi:hypothetical protein